MSNKLSRTLIPLLLYGSFSFLFFISTVGVMNSVDAPQFALVQALVDEGRTTIDTHMQYVHPDYATYHGSNFSEREPGLSFLAAPVYLLGKALAPLSLPPYGDWQHTGITTSSPVESTTYGFIGMVNALGILALYFLSKRLGHSELASVIVAIALGLGTLYWKYSGGFVRQPLIATIALSALLILYSRRQRSVVHNLAYGFLMGFLFITDHLGILLTLCLTSAYILKIKRQKFGLLLLALGASLPLLSLTAYNVYSFDTPFTSGRQYSVLAAIHDPKNVFIADLTKTIPLNLFSFGPIPAETFSYVKKIPDLGKAVADVNHWASIWIYRGIFIQSPILLFACLGLFFIRKRQSLFFLLLFSSYFIPASALYIFYNPTSYDTRYTLPAVPFLLLGLPTILDMLLKNKRKPLNALLLIVAGVLSVLSVRNGFISLVTHFAPHVSGERRWDMPVETLGQPQAFISSVIHAVPNVYNVHIFLIGLTLAISAFIVAKQIYRNFLEKSQGKL